MKRLPGISLKYQLLILLVAVPAGALAFYLILASRLFSDDKIAYVFDSNGWVARMLADQTRSEVEALKKQTGEWMASYNFSSRQFEETANRSFLQQQSVLQIRIFEPLRNGAYLSAGKMQQKVEDQSNEIGFRLQKFLSLIRERELVILPVQGDAEKVMVGLKIGIQGGREYRIALLSVSSQNVLLGFRKTGATQSYLVDWRGRKIVGPESTSGSDLDDLSQLSSIGRLLNQKLPEGTAETHSRSGKEYLASFAKIGVGDLSVLSFTEKDSALEAVSLLHRKSALFFLVVLALATILSVFASGKLTFTLRQLYRATQQIADGNFQVQVESKSRDEVGSLAQSFNRMAGEVSRLMTETASKARMEKELETARTVQETLFPAPRASLPGGTISGFFEPATECGGDWWHYRQIGHRIFIWVGDATGHGAPAALITSAAKSAASVIEKLAQVSPQLVRPSFIMNLLNRAIYETSKGRMLMTFFLASLDTKTGELTYCNASHDPPYLFPKKDTPLKKKDILPLIDVCSPRLGEKLDAEFAEGTLTLSLEDILMFYTDGLNDIKNQNHEAWGESRLVKAALAAVNETRDADQMSQVLHRAVDEYRQGSLLDDDLTCFVFKRARAA